MDISGVYHEGCAAFASVSPNVVADESVMKTDEGMTMEQRYTVVRLTFLCKRYSVLIWKIVIFQVVGVERFHSCTLSLRLFFSFLSPFFFLTD